MSNEQESNKKIIFKGKTTFISKITDEQLMAGLAKANEDGFYKNEDLGLQITLESKAKTENQNQ
jgi:hypothetical protein